MRGEIVARLSLLLLLIAPGCLADLNAYALRVHLEATSEPLRPAEVETLRSIARRVAADQDLMELQRYEGEGPQEEILDMYITPEHPSLDVALAISEDRREAHIQVSDWDSAGEVSARTRAIAKQVERDLGTQLPQRSVEVEARDLGFWRP